MAITKIEGVTVKGIAASVPRTVRSNWESPLLAIDEKEKVISSIGIEQVRIASSTMCTSDLCFDAATNILTQLGWSAEDIQILIFVSQSPDYVMPATSCILQNKLGMSSSSIAFDINLGCSGYVYGLNVISSMMKMSGIKRGLLLVGDTLSKCVSPLDRSVSILFGDAGTATALELGGDGSFCFNSNTDGSGWEAIQVKDGGFRNRYSSSSEIFSGAADDMKRRPIDISMNGADVFNFTIREVVKQINSTFSEFKIEKSEIDGFVFHQANKMINELLGKRLGVDRAKIPSSLSKFGNTSSATIPLTIVSQYEMDYFNQPKKFLLSGFGVGLSWATSIIELKNVALNLSDVAD